MGPVLSTATGWPDQESREKRAHLLLEAAARLLRMGEVPCRARADRWSGPRDVAPPRSSQVDLSELAPQLDIVVLEAERIGFGASGRNGGWLSHLVPGDRGIYEKTAHGRDGLVRLQREMVDAVDAVLKVAARQHLDIDAHKGGNLVVAPNEAGMERLRRRYAADREAGLSPEEVRMLSAREVRDRVTVAGAVGGFFAEPCARIHPGKLVR